MPPVILYGQSVNYNKDVWVKSIVFRLLLADEASISSTRFVPNFLVGMKFCLGLPISTTHKKKKRYIEFKTRIMS